MDSDLWLGVSSFKVYTVFIESLKIVRPTHVFELRKSQFAFDWPEVEEDVIVLGVGLSEGLVSVLVDT